MHGRRSCCEPVVRQISVHGSARVAGPVRRPRLAAWWSTERMDKHCRILFLCKGITVIKCGRLLFLEKDSQSRIALDKRSHPSSRTILAHVLTDWPAPDCLCLLRQSQYELPVPHLICSIALVSLAWPPIRRFYRRSLRCETSAAFSVRGISSVRPPCRTLLQTLVSHKLLGQTCSAVVLVPLAWFSMVAVWPVGPDMSQMLVEIRVHLKLQSRRIMSHISPSVYFNDN
jgi:hypothetical protein